MKATNGLRDKSPWFDGLEKGKAGLDSQASERSWIGVPLGVLLALSTRLCLDPERGVTLLFRRGLKGAAEMVPGSSYGARFDPFGTAVVETGRGCVRLGRGVVVLVAAATAGV